MFNQRKVSKKQLEYVLNQSGAGIYGQLALIVLVILIQYSAQVPYEGVIIWSLAISIVLYCRHLIAKQYKAYEATHHNRDKDSLFLKRYTINALLMGILWSISFIQMVMYSTAEFHFISLAIGLGLVSASILTMGPVPRVFLSFSIPIIVSLLMLIYMQTKAVHALAFLAAFLAFTYLLYTAYRYSHYFTEMHSKNDALKKSQLAVVRRLGKAGEYRDEATGNHIHRMSHASQIVARKMGFSPEKTELILHASAMHDVGKIGIPDNVLLKPDKLNDVEWETMKSHTTIGAEILGDDDSEVLKMAKVIAESHHERWDGSGYPKGLKGEDIPTEARITAVCDVYDALTSSRPYKKAWTSEASIKLIKAESGKHFDPKVVTAFVASLPEIIEATRKYNDHLIEK